MAARRIEKAGSADPVRVAIRDEVRLAAGRWPHVAVVSSRAPEPAEDDGLHYSTAGLLALGRRYAAGLAAAEAGGPVA